MRYSSELKPCMSGHTDCFAYRDGLCICLCDTDFHGKDCSFYATTAQVEENRKRCRERLAAIGAVELTEKYGGNM